MPKAVLSGVWTGANVGWWSVQASDLRRCLREVYAKPMPVPEVPWQESGETFGLSKRLMALKTTSRWKAKNIKTPVTMGC